MILLIFMLLCLSVVGGGYLCSLWFTNFPFEAGAIITALLLGLLISIIFLIGISNQKIELVEEELKEEDKENKE